MKQTGQKPLKNRVSMTEALVGTNYWRATWFCIIFGISLQLTGINALIWYSNTILSRMQERDPNSISPRLGTILIGVTNFVASIFSLFPVRYLGRRTLVVGGHFLMAILLCLVGVFSYYDYNTPMLIMILLFLITF